MSAGTDKVETGANLRPGNLPYGGRSGRGVFLLSMEYEKDGYAFLTDGFELSEIIPPQKQIHPRHCFHKTVSSCLR